jgi:hypothetical protein
VKRSPIANSDLCVVPLSRGRDPSKFVQICQQILTSDWGFYRAIDGAYSPVSLSKFKLLDCQDFTAGQILSAEMYRFLASIQGWVGIEWKGDRRLLAAAHQRIEQRVKQLEE